eukprot:6832069-Alexandrium_andersonii.AAC.1
MLIKVVTLQHCQFLYGHEPDLREPYQFGRPSLTVMFRKSQEEVSRPVDCIEVILVPVEDR